MLICLSLVASVSLSYGQLPTGAQILERSQKAYDSVKTFEQTSRGTIAGQSASGHILFSRPDHLRASGKNLFGQDFDLVCDGKKTSVYMVGAWQEEKSPEMGVASLTGVAAGVITRVPAMLFHFTWGYVNGSLLGKISVSSARIKGEDCYVLKSATPYPMTQWIDKSTYFVVKTSTEIMKRDMIIEFDRPTVNRPIPPSRFTK